ncbi:MAG: excinuclease ABC subunit UvrC [Gammaproteobacteria bacterium]
MTGDKKEFDGREYCKNLTGKPGVYRMLDATQTVIYVGKAKNLKNRVTSYFQSSKQHAPKTRSMVANIAGVEITVTHTEKEALILENNLIKELKPRYNVLLRDDKAYPYIYLSSDQKFPRLSFHRGARKGKGKYFGPYPGAGSVRKTLTLLQKLFQIRQCEDSAFNNRSRPCLQYQIDRCTAPCVNFIESEDYKQDVHHAELFLQGRNQEVSDLLADRMEQASSKLEFETAARYRDQINALNVVQQKQYISSGSNNVDIIACEIQKGMSCVTLFLVRGGHNLGNKVFFPAHSKESEEGEILTAFISQYYLTDRTDREIPPTILLSHKVEDSELIAEVMEGQCSHKVKIKNELRGDRARWVKMAKENASLALAQKFSTTSSQRKRNDALTEALGMDEVIERIECFDISHTMGESTVASCVVFGKEGALKAQYRRFNIKNIIPGDDYAAMHQALERRYSRIKKEDGKMPELLLIDGGKGQVTQAVDVLENLQITEITIVGVAKGPARKPGEETLVLSDGSDNMSLAADAPALHLIQQIRDEAHRFAITGHRKQRDKKRGVSPLEKIEGVGNKRRQSLIRHFGGLQGITNAGVDDLQQVPGISKQLAEKIYQVFHE